jgi:hypothetical protein
MKEEKGMPLFTRPENPIGMHENRDPWAEAVGGFATTMLQKDWRGPTHLAESIRTVTEFLTRQTPAS